MSTTLYEVTIGDVSTRVRISDHTPIDDIGTFAKDYDGGYHNFSGKKGYAIERAVIKLFGKR